jgi:hypothetical protein
MSFGVGLTCPLVNNLDYPPRFLRLGQEIIRGKAGLAAMFLEFTSTTPSTEAMHSISRTQYSARSTDPTCQPSSKAAPSRPSLHFQRCHSIDVTAAGRGSVPVISE